MQGYQRCEHSNMLNPLHPEALYTHLLTVWQLNLLELLRQLLNKCLCLLLLPYSCQPWSVSCVILDNCNWPLQAGRFAC